MAHFPPAHTKSPDSDPAMQFPARDDSAGPDGDLRELLSSLALPETESKQLTLDLILHDIAERVRQQTNASGAAIALERNGEILCRAAAGATAPDLGARIDTKSGLTGFCVREQKAQRCDDTLVDWRVDGEACRGLGVRSIMVVPIMVANSPVGVLEVFSPAPHAFRQEDLETLEEMARWVTEATESSAAKVTAPDERTVVIRPSTTFVDNTPVPARTRIARAVSFWQRSGSDDRGVRILRSVALALAVMVGVMLVFRLGRQKWSSSRQPNPSSVSARQKPIQDNKLEAGLNPSRPAASTVTSKSTSVPGRSGPVKKASLSAYNDDEVTYRQFPVSSPVSKGSAETLSTGDGVAAGAGSPGQSNELAEETPPPLTIPAATTAGVPESVLGEPDVAMPTMRTSNVVEARLIHSVDPKYPREAVERGLHGTVIVRVRIGADGRMHDLKPLKGDATLAQAAVEAIRQWRYQPSKLNGKPVDSTIDITVNFSLPQ